MPTLAIPAPDLDYEALETGLAALERPINVLSATPTLPSGTQFGPPHLGRAGYFMYRRQAATVPDEIWDEEARQWQPDPGDNVTSLRPDPLAFDPGNANPWRSIMVAMGRKDNTDQDQFERASGNFPQYFVRSYFAGSENGTAVSGLSEPSTPVCFSSMLDVIRAGIGAGPNQTALTASEVMVFLRNNSLQTIGTYSIRRIGALAELEIENRNAGGAMIRLLPTGDVVIQPAPGRSLKVIGPMETGPISHRPDWG